MSLEPQVDNALAYYPNTDAGNAERLVHRVGGLVLHTPGRGWSLWNGQRYELDPSERILHIAIDTTRATAATAELHRDDKTRDELKKHTRESERLSRLRAMLEIARVHPRVEVPADQLDANPDHFNALNGTIYLPTGTHRPHNPHDRITKVSLVTYDPHATAPTWQAFQDRISGGDEDLIRFKQRAFGYTLTGHTREQAFFIKYGTGSNGKTVEDEIIAAILNDYAATASFEAFSQARTNRSKADAELADLLGVRFVRTSESDAGGRLSESTVKDVTGEGYITAKRLYESPFQYRPRFKLWMSTNHKPVIRGADHGIWRRVRLIPYSVTIPPHEQDPHLTTRLREELPGILTWLVEGAKAWYHDGLGTVQAVHTATTDYREEMDTLGAFLEQATHNTPRATTRSNRLHAAYRTWCTDNGENPISTVRFAQAMQERGHTKRKDADGVHWLDLALSLTGEAWADQTPRRGTP